MDHADDHTASTTSPPPTNRPDAPPATAEEWEQVRRSVAMLPPGAWAMRREQSLQMLATLLAALRKAPNR